MTQFRDWYRRKYILLTDCLRNAGIPFPRDADPVPEEPELEPHDLLGDDERAPDGQVIADFRRGYRFSLSTGAFAQENEVIRRWKPICAVLRSVHAALWAMHFGLRGIDTVTGAQN
jgi:hypothetical protein